MSSSAEYSASLASRTTLQLHRMGAAFVFASAISSTIIFALAASAYPGGNYFDRAATAHDFWRNTLCDVARSTAIGGGDNTTGAFYARTAMTIMALGIGGLFWLLPDHFRGYRRSAAFAKWVRVLGTIAVPASIAVVFLPTDRFSALHGVAIVAAGPFGIAAALLAVLALVRAQSLTRPIALIGVIALGVAASDFVLYVDELVRGGDPRMAVSVLERISTLLILAWMIAAARASLKLSRCVS